MRISIAYIFSQACRMVCVLGLMCSVMCGLSSCHWHEAKEVIAVADSLDQMKHVIYDDTAALGRVIRSLDNPFGRLFQRNTLGKAYYYMGRNLEDKSRQVADATKCYIEADCLQIDDPIYRGRVNSCMGYICRQNNSDSLAFIFYERACKIYEENINEWYYAQSLLNIASCYIDLHLLTKADSILNAAEVLQLDDLYIARYYEKRGLYFEAQQQHDSVLMCFKHALTYRENDRDKSYDYLKIMQAYYDMGDISLSIPYAHYILKHSTNPNYLVNVYYCMMQDAKKQNNTELLSYYSHARTDAQKQLRDDMIKYAEALPLLEEYLKDPHPLRWIKIVLFSFVALCVVLTLSLFRYRKHTIIRMRVSDEQIVSLSAQVQEHQDKLEKQSKEHLYDKNLDKIRRKYPKPLNRWNEYTELKKDIQSYLHNWFISLEKLDLTNREKVFCVISFVYPQMATEDLANYLCITKEALPVRKNRIAKKLGITSVELGVFLQKLANNK